MHHRHLHLGLALVLALVVAAPGHAGQVRVSVDNNEFSPAVVTLNRGDHVVWVWSAGTHSVTSGASCTQSGVFNTGNQTVNAIRGTTFSWKTTLTSTGLPYYCIPHCFMGMTGTIVVTASGTPVADFRITEVQYNTGSGQHLVEITNFGAVTGDFGRYRFFSGNDSCIVPHHSLLVPSQGRVRVHVNASGTQSATDLYLPTLADLTPSGSLSLWAPNTVSSGTDQSQIIDFVQWGAAGQPNESVADMADIWTTGEFLASKAPGHSLEFCGAPTDRGMAHWAEVSTPNVGTDGNCATPGLPLSWGKLKVIYR